MSPVNGFWPGRSATRVMKARLGVAQNRLWATAAATPASHQQASRNGAFDGAGRPPAPAAGTASCPSTVASTEVDGSGAAACGRGSGVPEVAGGRP